MKRRGPVVILNGAPRSGKSGIATALDAIDEHQWLNIGVDSAMAETPEDRLPGIGLRPGGERPDLEDDVLAGYQALFDSIAIAAADGQHIAVDVGIHDSYTKPLQLWQELATRLSGVPAYIIGVRCSLDTILQRRANAPERGRTTYEVARCGVVPQAVYRWQEAVHSPGRYDLEVDTTAASPQECARTILRHIDDNDPEVLPEGIDVPS